MSGARARAARVPRGALALAAVWLACRRGRRSAAALAWIDAAGLLAAGAALGWLGHAQAAFVDLRYPWSPTSR